MSSADEDAAPASKKRKVQRACDHCRRKKLKCDGPQVPKNSCSRCTARGIECTYVEGLYKSSYPSSYVENLETRLERMEKLVDRLCPGTDMAKELDDHQSDKDTGTQAHTPASEQSHGSRSLVAPSITPSRISVTPSTPTSESLISDDPQSDEDDIALEKDLTDNMQKLSMNARPFRYHGKSSNLVLFRSAIGMKSQYAGPRGQHIGQARHPWLKSTVEDDLPLFHEGDFPSKDLMDTLVELYFRHMNDLFPLLHEPTFKKGIERRRHLRHGGFGAIAMLVCANGSRFTQDPRVLLDDSGHPDSAGWKWFRKVEDARKLPLAPAKLYDLQIYVLMVLFLQGTAAPQATWILIGVGLRAAIDVGAHRRRMYSPAPAADEELWRRAFWILIVLEWMICYGMGRPSSIHDEDFDLALPTECDDEYWTTPEGENLFKQPPGKPSRISAFVYLIRLEQILGFTMRTIYSTNKSRAQLGQSDHKWEERIVSELDSSLNKWLDSLPTHLRWNPDQDNEQYLTQAGMLAAYHRQLQIAVHRQFITSSRRESPLSFPSQIICMNAARATIQVLEVIHKRTGTLIHKSMSFVCMSGIILMMNVLGLKRLGRAVNVEKDLALVRKAVEILRAQRYKLHYAEPLGEVLVQLMSADSERPSPHSGLSTGAKDSPADAGVTQSPSSPIEVHFGGPMGEGRTGVSETSPQPTASGVNSAAGPSSASTSFAESGRISHLSDGIDFPQYNISHFGSPAAWDGPRTMSSHGGLEYMPQPSAFPHNTPTYSSFQRQTPLQRHHPSGTPGSAGHQGQGFEQGRYYSEYDGSMFGLEPLGYSEPVSSLPAVAVSQGNANVYYPHSTQHLGHEPMGPQEYADINVPEFALMDDAAAMAIWSNAPPTFQWDDWGVYFTNAHSTGS